MDSKRKLQGNTNREDKNKIETLPNLVMFSTLQLSMSEFFPIQITPHNTTQDIDDISSVGGEKLEIIDC